MPNNQKVGKCPLGKCDGDGIIDRETNIDMITFHFVVCNKCGIRTSGCDTVFEAANIWKGYNK